MSFENMKQKKQVEAYIIDKYTSLSINKGESMKYKCPNCGLEIQKEHIEFMTATCMKCLEAVTLVEVKETSKNIIEQLKLGIDDTERTINIMKKIKEIINYINKMERV